MELIIAEKPSAAKKIAEALADGKPTKKTTKKVSYYELTHNKKPIVVACAVGHLYTLAEKVKSKGFVYPVFDIDWAPSYTVDRGASYTKDYVTTLQKVTKKAKTYTVACDYDTEGSLIGLNVVRYICKQNDARRMKFSTLTKPDLVKAYAKAGKHLDWGQAKAGETRHFLDFYYGINISRALTSAIKSSGMFKILSTGRVQGPALKIVVEREREIRAFVPKPFWEIELHGAHKRKKFVALHEEEKFWEESKAKEVFEKCSKQDAATVAKVEARKFKQKPPHPFDLTSLQTEAYRLFRIKPKDTLSSAQGLYLAGLISYPRTSSQQYPDAIGYKKIISALKKNSVYAELCGLLSKKKSLKPNNGKKTDPAHPAIYPTGTQPGGLKPYEAKIYDLIVKRFLATFGDNAQRETVNIHLSVADEPFKSKGTRTIEKGWHVLYAPYVKLEEEEMPALKEKDVVKIQDLTLIDKETQPPKRYTPASLVKELERRSLGTKATRSEIVERLYKRKYIVEESIQATDFGVEIIKVLESHVPRIVDPELTRQFEQDMENIREDKKDMDSILSRAKKVLTGILDEFKSKEKQVGLELRKTLEETKLAIDAIGTCPKCGKGHLIIKHGKFGKFAACDKYPDCKTTFHLPKALIKPTEQLCEYCKYPVVQVIKKRSKPQLICINQDCPGKASAVEVKQKPCDKCGKGTMIVRKSFYGTFLACDQYPKCHNTESIEHMDHAQKKTA